MGEVGWQFSWAHPFPGIDKPCDADRFSGNLDQWRAAIGMHAAPEPHVVRPSHVPLPPPGTSYERGDGGNNAQGWGVAALQNGLRFVTGARLFPSSPPTFGAETEPRGARLPGVLQAGARHHARPGLLGGRAHRRAPEPAHRHQVALPEGGAGVRVP